MDSCTLNQYQGEILVRANAVWFGRLSRTDLESCLAIFSFPERKKSLRQARLSSASASDAYYKLYKTNTYKYKMKILRILTCILSLFNLQNHIYCQREYSPQLAEYLQRAGRPTVMQHFSTFGETREDYDARGSNIVDFVTLKTYLKSSFSSKGRF